MKDLWTARLDKDSELTIDLYKVSGIELEKDGNGYFIYAYLEGLKVLLKSFSTQEEKEAKEFYNLLDKDWSESGE
jgi:hypothetical protein